MPTGPDVYVHIIEALARHKRSTGSEINFLPPDMNGIKFGYAGYLTGPGFCAIKLLYEGSEPPLSDEWEQRLFREHRVVVSQKRREF